MDFLDFAMRMAKFWVLGAFICYLTVKSENKDLLRVQFKSVARWSIFLLILTVYRILTLRYMFSMNPSTKDSLRVVSTIPWAATLTVFWEDAAHSLPLALLRRLLKERKLILYPIYAVSLLLISVAFGAGHLYQGVFRAAFLSLYIPLAVKLGEEKGFGTVMVCHSLYDLSTILAIQMVMGAA